MDYECGDLLLAGAACAGCWVTEQGCVCRLCGDLNNGLAAQFEWRKCALEVSCTWDALYKSTSFLTFYTIFDVLIIVQLTARKDSSLKWPIMCWAGHSTLLLASYCHKLTTLFRWLLQRVNLDVRGLVPRILHLQFYILSQLIMLDSDPRMRYVGRRLLCRIVTGNLAMMSNNNARYGWNGWWKSRLFE